MNGKMAMIGVVGAIAVLVGLALVGAGLIISSEATQTEYNCEFGFGSGASCASTSHQAENTTVLGETITGFGAIVAGLGFCLVAVTVVTTMSRRAEAVRGMSYPTSSPPPPPSPPF